MKVITYVKREIGEPYIKVEHEIRVGYSARYEQGNNSGLSS